MVISNVVKQVQKLDEILSQYGTWDHVQACQHRSEEVGDLLAAARPVLFAQYAAMLWLCGTTGPNLSGGGYIRTGLQLFNEDSWNKLPALLKHQVSFAWVTPFNDLTGSHWLKNRFGATQEPWPQLAPPVGDLPADAYIPKLLVINV